LGGETAWRLFNATTFVLTGLVAENPTATKQFHEMIDGFCEVMNWPPPPLPAGVLLREMRVSDVRHRARPHSRPLPQKEAGR
jgi:hypothetical protein